MNAATDNFIRYEIRAVFCFFELKQWVLLESIGNYAWLADKL
jgi:hypothetical protein